MQICLRVGASSRKPERENEVSDDFYANVLNTKADSIKMHYAASNLQLIANEFSSVLIPLIDQQSRQSLCFCWYLNHGFCCISRAMKIASSFTATVRDFQFLIFIQSSFASLLFCGGAQATLSQII